MLSLNGVSYCPGLDAVYRVACLAPTQPLAVASMTTPVAGGRGVMLERWAVGTARPPQWPALPGCCICDMCHVVYPGLVGTPLVLGRTLNASGWHSGAQ